MATDVRLTWDNNAVVGTSTRIEREEIVTYFLDNFNEVSEISLEDHIPDIGLHPTNPNWYVENYPDRWKVRAGLGYVQGTSSSTNDMAAYQVTPESFRAIIVFPGWHGTATTGAGFNFRNSVWGWNGYPSYTMRVSGEINDRKARLMINNVNVASTAALGNLGEGNPVTVDFTVIGSELECSATDLNGTVSFTYSGIGNESTTKIGLVGYYGAGIFTSVKVMTP